MLGYGRLALEQSISHATKRVQFGRSISQFQAIQHMLANMGTELYAARSMMFDTAHKNDQKCDIRMEASMCKLLCSETAFRAVDNAVQVHGGVGLMKGSAVEFLFRVLRMYRILTGTSEIQRNTIAKSMLKNAQATNLES